MADENNRKMGRAPAARTSKRNMDMENKVFEAAKENIFSNFRRGLKKAEKQYKDIPSEMKKDPKTDTEIKLKLLKGSKKDAQKEFKDTRREVFATERMAKGGRAGFKSGMRVCKLAKRGKGRDYGKNS